MLSYTLFKLGPFKICLWNIIAITLIFFIAALLGKIIHKSIKKYLISANIHLEGNKTTWLKLLSQSVYILATYLAVISFNINNEDVGFTEFMTTNIVEIKSFKVNFFQIIVILIYFFGARMLLNFLKLYYNKKFRNKTDYNPSTEFVYLQISKYIIYIFVLIFSLNTLNVSLTSLFIGSAALLVGIGLGLQDVFKDVFSGIILLFEGNIKIGDIIELQDTKFRENIVAKIKQINIRTTQIETQDGNLLIIPNAKLTQEYVENWNKGNSKSRFNIEITVSYETDLDLLVNLLKQAALSQPQVKKDEPIDVRLVRFSDNGIDCELLFWADQSWEINLLKSNIRFEINKLFKDYKISIPYPQRVFHQA